jgi:hypothetical protein
MASKRQVMAARRNVKKRSKPRARSAALRICRRAPAGRKAAKSRQQGGRAGHALEDRSRQQFDELAKKRGIEGRSKMGKWS